ncbi:MAG: hypothetical protein ACW981_17055 [Candidatus Hodarchaeales archaeon]|jgi:hypothetical protein
MKYLLREEKEKLVVTKKLNRFLGIIFFILGTIFCLTFFSVYIMVFIGQIDTLSIIGTTYFVASFLPFFDILFVMGGGLIVGAFYFSFWSEGWETKSGDMEKLAGIEFFSGVFNFKKRDFISKNELNDLYVEKIPIDELQSFFLYQIILKSQNIKKNEEIEKILIKDTDKDRIHLIGLKLIKILCFEKELDYRIVEREILR